MISKPSISTYVSFLVITVTVASGFTIVLQFSQNRTVARLEDRLANYHRLTILACGQLENDLFRFQSDVHVAPETPTTERAIYSVAELRTLLKHSVLTITEYQDQYDASAFERSARNVIDSHIALENLLSEYAAPRSRAGILQSDEWSVFLMRLLQQKRLHSATSERVSAELQEIHRRAFRSDIMFIGVTVTIVLIIVIRIMSLIRAGLAEQQATSDALRESRERAQAILDNAAEAIATIDERGIIEAFNKAAEKTFGYSTFEVIGNNISMLMPEPHQSDHDNYLQNYLDTGDRKVIGITREVEGRRKDGAVFPIELSISEVLLNGRRIFTGIILDISERKNLEGQLRQSQKMDAVGRLAGGVAHDFNNMLTVIQGYASVIGDDTRLPEELREELGEILLAANRAQDLTKQLLAFSRKQVLQPKSVNLNDIVDEAKRMLVRLIGEHIQLVTTLDPALAMMKADPSQIEQIVLNLALNARDAMTDGGTLTIETANIEVDAAYAIDHTSVAPGSYCMLEVRDTGVGMDQETRGQIFEPFFTTKEAGKGTGLGLSTVYGIVQQSGGHVWFESEPNQGTIFKVYFSVLDEDEIDTTPTQAANPRTTLRGDETVLVVEDEETVRRLVLRVLGEHGYHAIEARSPEEALKLFRERSEDIDIVVTDVIMPGMSGRELAERLVKVQHDVPMLFMSGYTNDEIAHHGVLEEDVHFIHKPFSPVEFVEKVRAVLDSRKHQKTSAHEPSVR